VGQIFVGLASLLRLLRGLLDSSFPTGDRLMPLIVAWAVLGGFFALLALVSDGVQWLLDERDFRESFAEIFDGWFIA